MTLEEAIQLLQQAIDAQDWATVEEVLHVLYEISERGGTTTDVWE